MSKVAIVTDSTAYIPLDIAKEYSLSVVPLNVVWGNENLRDGVDILPEDFYDRLKTSDVMPTTSQPSPAVFKEVYTQLLDDGFDVLSIHISSGLSGTPDSARQARDMLDTSRIEVIDSLTTGMDLGLQVLMAAQKAQQDASLQECKQLALDLQSRSGIYFAVSTLEFLQRGGRIGTASAFLGTVLNIKPVLMMNNGRIEAVEKNRTMTKALNRLIDLIAESVNGYEDKKIHLATVHANAQKEAQSVVERARERLGGDDTCFNIVTDVSPVIGTHTGPGTVGLAYLIEL